MKAAIVYDTQYGNTEKLAQAIGEAIGGQVLRAGEVQPGELAGFDLLIVGTPTHGGFQTPAIDALLKAMTALQGRKVAAFDTRTKTTIFGYAAPRIAKRLEQSGAKLVAPAEGFMVQGTKGPLLAGELERAVRWAREMTVRP